MAAVGRARVVVGARRGTRVVRGLLGSAGMSNRPSIAALMWCAGLALVGGCASNGVVLQDSSGWPVPTHALRSVTCYRMVGDQIIWWSRASRQERPGVWTCDAFGSPLVDANGQRRYDREPPVPTEPAVPAPPVRPPSVGAVGEPTLDTVR